MSEKLSKILIYFHEKMFTCNFLNTFKFSPSDLFTKYVSLTALPVFITSFFQRQRDMISKDFFPVYFQFVIKHI